MNLPVLVLAGGRGERMRPLTDYRPKCLLNVGNRSFAGRQVEWLHTQGLTDITFSLGYLGAQVEQELGLGIKYTYAVNCGIQGAIRQANMQGPFYLLYGDVWPQYPARDLFDTWSGADFDCIMGRCEDYYDTGFSLLAPGMNSILFINVPSSLEIGSPEGYAATRRYFGETLP